MRRLIWSSPENPDNAVARQLGLARHELRERLHAMKAQSGLRGTERVRIYSDGDVEDAGGHNWGT